MYDSSQMLKSILDNNSLKIQSRIQESYMLNLCTIKVIILCTIKSMPHQELLFFHIQMFTIICYITKNRFKGFSQRGWCNILPMFYSRVFSCLLY